MEDIEDTLIEELNGVRHEIEEGKNKLLTEFEKLKKLRAKSEDTFLKALKEIEDRYEGVLAQVLNTEEERFNEWERCGDKAIKVVEFEKEVHLSLTDALYSTKGKVIYSEIIKSSAEFSYLSTLLSKPQTPFVKLQKAFHVNFSDIEFNEQILSPRLFTHLSLVELKEFLINRRLPQFKSHLADESFPGEIQLDLGPHIIVALRAEK